MKNRINLSVISLRIIELISFFVPLCLKREYWKYDEKSFVYHGSATLKSLFDENIFAVDDVVAKIFAILVVAISIISIVFCVLEFMGTEKFNNKGFIISLIHFLLVIVFYTYTCNFVHIEYSTAFGGYRISWLFYLIMGINIYCLIIEILKKYGKLNNQNIKKKVKSSQPTEKEYIKELIEYKQLLDSGIITQEEFDEKKKHLLK